MENNMAVDTMYYYFLCLLLFLFCIQIVHHTFIKPSNKFQQPPSPPALPILGHFHLLTSALPKSLQTLAQQYGPLMQIRMGSSRFIVASSASIAKEILKTHDIEFASKFVFAPSHYNIYKEAEFVNAPYGTYWRFMKKLCMTKLFAGPQLDRFFHIREDETMRLLESLWRCYEEGESCDLSTELTTLTNNMMCRMAMSKRCSRNPNQAKEIREMVRDTMVCGAKLSFAEVHGPLKRVDLFGNGKRLRAALKRFDNLLDQIIKEYEDNYNSEDEDKDVMDILLETYRDPTAEIRLTMDQIKHFFLDLLIAGVDTTSASMQWAITELIHHPHVLNKLREEIDSTIISPTRLVNESDISKLPYLQAIIKETLRLHTPGPLLRRKCNKDTAIDGYNIESGTNILINAYAIMHDPDTWKNPDEFEPERFLIDHNEMEFKGQDFHFLPFGSGRRACIGLAHATIVMHTAIGALVQCFDLKLKDEEKVDIKVVSGYSGAMARSLLINPIGRLNPSLVHEKCKK